MAQVATMKPAVHTIYGPVCGVSHLSVQKQLNRTETLATRNDVLGLRLGLERGRTITTQQLPEGVSIKSIFEKLHVVEDKMPVSVGGSAAIAARAALQLSDVKGTEVHLRGFVGNDTVGRYIWSTLAQQGIDPKFLTVLPGASARNYVIHETIETASGEKRVVSTTIHDPGVCAEIPHTVLSQHAKEFNLVANATNVLTFTGTHLMPKIHPFMEYLLTKAKEQDSQFAKSELDWKRKNPGATRPEGRSLISILDLDDDPARKWDLPSGMPKLVDLLLMNRTTASAFFALKEFYPPEIIDRLIKEGFINGVVTDGSCGAYIFSEQQGVFSFEARTIAYRVPILEAIAQLSTPRQLYGVGPVSAAALAVAAVENMEIQLAVLFAMAAAGKCVQTPWGKIGDAVTLGGCRSEIDELLKGLSRQNQEYRASMLAGQFAGLGSKVNYAIDTDND
ncbi:MAG: hypothetical protein WC527_08840 [Candidatus Margulisiibacteriota bacterium]